jgi:hypothetical protein
MNFVENLLKNASRVLETAEIGESLPLTVIIASGRVQKISSVNDWSLEMLIQEYRADEAYRVSRVRSLLTVEGCSRTGRVHLSKRDNILQMRNGRWVCQNNIDDIKTEKMQINSRASRKFQSCPNHIPLLIDAYSSVG